MKKFLAIILIVFTMLSTSALAAETTFVEPFTLFDFGSESKLDDMWKINLLSAATTNNCIREENEDSWTITVTMIEDDATTATKIAKKTPHLYISGISNITFGSQLVNNGWGGYKASGYKTATDEWNYALNAEWVGKNQFFKIRIKNLTANEKIAFFPLTVGNYSHGNPLIFDISANDTEFQTYVVDAIKAEIRGYSSSSDKYTTYFSNNAYGIWRNDVNVNGFRFWFFASYGSNASPEDITYKNIQIGDTVEVDYIIFAPTAEMAAEYKSFDEGYVSSETTTTESVVETTTTESVVETTTTESVVETTTTESVIETTTTESVVETTTTESVVETTTTESVVETTTTESVVETTTTESVVETTTTEQNTDTDKDGGFPVWIIIVIVVVIGVGIAALFVFKKK